MAGAERSTAGGGDGAAAADPRQGGDGAAAVDPGQGGAARKGCMAAQGAWRVAKSGRRGSRSAGAEPTGGGDRQGRRPARIRPEEQEEGGQRTRTPG